MSVELAAEEMMLITLNSVTTSTFQGTRETVLNLCPRKLLNFFRNCAEIFVPSKSEILWTGYCLLQITSCNFNLNYTLHEIVLVLPYKQRGIILKCPLFVIALVPDLFFGGKPDETCCHSVVASKWLKTRVSQFALQHENTTT